MLSERSLAQEVTNYDSTDVMPQFLIFFKYKSFKAPSDEQKIKARDQIQKKNISKEFFISKES